MSVDNPEVLSAVSKRLSGLNIHVVTPPRRYYADIAERYVEQFGCDLEDATQYGGDSVVPNMLTQHPTHTSDYREASIYVLRTALFYLHAGDFGGRPAQTFSGGGGRKARQQYFLDLAHWFAQESEYGEQCRRRGCAVYLYLGMEWTEFAVINVRQQLFRETGVEFNVISNSMHSMSSPWFSRNLAKLDPHSAASYASTKDVVAPYFHHSSELEAIQRQTNNGSNSKYFASAAFTFDAVGDSAPYRKKIAHDLKAYGDECRFLHLSRHGAGQRYEDRTEEVLQMYASSVFCAASRGDIQNGRRLYTALLCGCIPVVVGCDKQWLAFETFLDWSEFCVVIPEAEVSVNGKESWVQWLKQHISASQQERMQHKVHEVRRHFVYSLDTDEGNALDFLVAEMQFNSIGFLSVQRWAQFNL